MFHDTVGKKNVSAGVFVVVVVDVIGLEFGPNCFYFINQFNPN